jgi:hypothetical protein
VVPELNRAAVRDLGPGLAAILEQTHKVTSTGISITITAISAVSISEIQPEAVRDRGRADATAIFH